MFKARWADQPADERTEQPSNRNIKPQGNNEDTEHQLTEVQSIRLAFGQNSKIKEKRNGQLQHNI